MAKSFLFLFFSLCCNLSAANIEYYELSAEEKREYIWKNITLTEYRTLPPLLWQGWASLLLDLKKIPNRKNPQDHDLYAVRKKRVMFVYGTVAKISFVPLLNSYDGIFKSGALGLARFSLMADPNKIGSFIPHISIRFLIDDSPGLSSSFLKSFSGQGNNNDWFFTSFSNIIEPSPYGSFKMVESMINQSLSYPNHFPIAHLAKRMSNGRLSFDNKAPYELILRPTELTKGLIKSHSSRDFRRELERLQEHMPIYEVLARSYEGDMAILIGYLNLESRFVASDFGDTRITF